MASFYAYQLFTIMILILPHNAQIIEINSSSLNYIGIVMDSLDELEWEQAQNYCKSNYNTSLATVQSSTDWDEIYNLATIINTIPLPEGDGAYLHIGFRSNSNGNLVWAPCYDINNDCTYDPCEANCDVYADDWTNKAREATFNTNGCGFIERAGTNKNWFDGACGGNKDFICNSPYGKYKTDINCQDKGLIDSEYTQESDWDIKCGLHNHFPRNTAAPSVRVNSSSLNYIGILWDAGDELGWYYAQTYCKITFDTSLATVQSAQDWSEMYTLADTINGIGGVQGDGTELWIGYKANSKDNLVWAPCHDSIYDDCIYDPCEANCDAYADNWNGKSREAIFDTNTCGRITRGGSNKNWADESCTILKDFICNSPWGKYKNDISCIDTGLLDNEFTNKPGFDVSCNNPSLSPTKNPSMTPTNNPSMTPTNNPTPAPTTDPTPAPTINPTNAPSYAPTQPPSITPSFSPTVSPTISPFVPGEPTESPTDPSNKPTNTPTYIPTVDPTKYPTTYPTSHPTTYNPTINPTHDPTVDPTIDPTLDPTTNPTHIPTSNPTSSPTAPSLSPTLPEGQVGTTSYSSDESKGLASNKDESFLEKNLFLLIIAGAACLLCCVTLCIIILLKKKKKQIGNQQDMDLERITSVSTKESPGEGNVLGGDTLTGETMQHTERDIAVIPQEPFSNEQQIKMWLNNVGLIEYYELFIKNGFGDGTEAIMDVTNEDLKDMGIEKVGHRKLILKQIKKNNQQMDMIQMATMVQSVAVTGEQNKLETDDDDKTDDEIYGGNNIGTTDDGYNKQENNDMDNDNVLITPHGNNDDEQKQEDSLDILYENPLRQTTNGDT